MQIKERLIDFAGHLLAATNHLIWPAVCTCCNDCIHEDSGNLCQKCWSELLESTGGDYCRRCGRNASKFAFVDGACADCREKEILFDGIARAGVYTHSLQQMILKFKNGGSELSVMLGELASSALQGSGFYDEIELLVPVPLHWSRRLLRGYNQSVVLARQLSKAGFRINTELVRIRRTKMQPVMLSDAARRRNVAGAFAVRTGNRFKDRNICLIDDIKTTGATLNECARVLKSAGAARIYALVLAVAGQKTS